MSTDVKSDKIWKWLSLSDENFEILDISGETVRSPETIYERFSTQDQLDHVAAKCINEATLAYLWCRA